jgi:hypothetical protein
MKKPINGILIASVCLTLACICCPVNLPVSSSPTATIPQNTLAFIPEDTATIAPVDTPMPCQDASCVESCPTKLEEILQASEGESSPLKTFTGNTETEGTEHKLVTYRVDGDALSAPTYLSVPADLIAYREDNNTQMEIWKLFTAMIPLSQREFVNEYVIFTDGGLDLLAAVEKADQAGKWSLQVDIVDAKDRLALGATLLHEFAHLITLNISQAESDDYICTTDYINPGCGREGSYIDLFYQRFWSGIFEEWQTINAIDNPDDWNDQMDKFYLNHQTEFLTAYSATEPAEDIAEAWMFFILSPQPAGGTTVAEEKMLFFYDFPELVQLRMDIRSRLCGYLFHPTTP